MGKVVELQVTMFALMLVGLFVKKWKLVSDQGQKDLTDLVVYVILPCNILYAFLSGDSGEVMEQFAWVFGLLRNGIKKTSFR